MGPDICRAIADGYAERIETLDDVRGSAWYRTEMVRVWVRRALEGRPPLLNNGTNPRVQVVGVAKKLLKQGKVLRHPIGSFEVRGVAITIADHPDHVPIGLLDGARLTRHVEAEKVITLDDVELPGSRALALWRGLR